MFRRTFWALCLCLLPLTAEADSHSHHHTHSDHDPHSDSVADFEPRLDTLSFGILAALGGSSEDDETLELLQGGAHDPRERGFTLQQAELSLGGSIGSLLRGEGHFVVHEGEGVETEEVFVTLPTLPGRFEVEVGYFLTEFGLLNPQHSHYWQFVDQPVILTRLFGGDGMRGAGVRFARPLGLPWKAVLHFGVQQSTGEFMPSFRGTRHTHGTEGHSHEMHEEDDEHGIAELEGDSVGGRPRVNFATTGLDDFVYLLRLENFVRQAPRRNAKVGASFAYGPNSSGEEGHTFLYGADMLLEWRLDEQENGQSVLLQGEALGRSYSAAAISDEEHELFLPEEEFEDWGAYLQLHFGFAPQWMTGLRAEWAGGSGASVLGRDEDPFRADRLRISPLLSYTVNESFRVRAQYNYDNAVGISREVHSVWIALELRAGLHNHAH